MSGCKEWEELLLQYEDLEADTRRSVDRHLAACAGCRGFLETLETIDLELTAMLRDMEPAPGFDTRVLARASAMAPTRLWITEALDGIGWLSIAGILTLLAAHWTAEWNGTRLPAAWLSLAWLQPLGAVLIAAALAYGLHTWRRLAD